MSLLAALKPKGPSGFGYASTAEDVTAGTDLSGKTILITGTGSGLGQETTRVLGMRGASIVSLARSAEDAQAALDTAGATGLAIACDLSEPASVRSAAATVKAAADHLDAIVCNAGIMAPATLQQKYGYELQFLTNHLGHFALATALVDHLSSSGRVVVLSSGAHKGAPAEGIQFDNLDGSLSYTPWQAYGQSKLANALFARALAKRLPASTQTANAVHPGVIATNLSRHMGGVAKGLFGLMRPLAFKNVGQGAATQCYVATHPDTAAVSGGYFADSNVATPSELAQDDGLAERLWLASETMIANLPAVA
jgi:WW domain-containing oxidoreductase